ISFADVEAALFGTGLNAFDAYYAFANSLLQGDLTYSLPTTNPHFNVIEVGQGGTATVTGGSGQDVLYLWHDKNLVWNAHAGSGNTLQLVTQNGTVTTAPHALVLNLQTGLGTNPYGGTLALSNVHNVQVGSVSGVYIVGDNSGDTLNAGHLFGG